MPRLFCALGCALLLSGLPPSAQEQRPAPQPKFETSAEVVLVDVTVSSSNGEPVTDLDTADFKLTVNGQARPVHTVQFISSRGLKAPAESPRLANVSSNDQPSSGRLLLFVVDENYLKIGSGRSVLRTAERVMGALAPGDAVGLARLPTGRGGVEFTTNRDRIRRALSGILGAQSPRSGERVRLSEAHALEINDQTTWNQVIDRECGASTVGTGAIAASMGREACVDELEAQAKNVLGDASARTRQSISGFEQLATRLAAMKTPVNVILISEGLYIGRDRNDLTQLARLAAQARITFFVVQPDESMQDNDQLRTSGSFSDEVLAEGLEQLAGYTRGSYFKVATSAAGVFDRISRELSGYYLLSFEPTEADRTSRDRRIRVEVSRRGLTVKARSTYALADGGATASKDLAALPPEEQVKSLLASPLPASGLPIRVATYSVSSPEANRVRVVLSAEIGEAGTNSVEWPVGVLVFNRDDKVIVNSTRYMTLEPATSRAASPRVLNMTMVLDPGEYTLRLAAIDHEGKYGSVHHSVDARFHDIAGDAVRASDLMISSEVVEGGAPRPVPTGIQYSESMYSILELMGNDADRLSKSRVSIQIADSDTSPALFTAEAKPLPRGKTQRAYAALLRLDVLPPGEYVARAVVKVPGRPDAVVTRAFRLAPVAAASDDAPAPKPVSVDDAPAPLPAAKVNAPVAKFAIEDVLGLNVVRPFLDYLEREHPVSAAHAAVVQQAREGNYVLPPDDGKTVDRAEVTLAFIRGLALLQKRQYPQAAAWFQVALKNASDFLGAAFYLGAVHAAAGRDTDAIGAWQMATIGEGGESIYPMLVDAQLRIGDAQAALDTVAEAPDAWPSEDARITRVATAQAMLGQFGPALEALNGLLQRSPNDADLLFVAIQVLYRQHQTRPLAGGDRARFDDYSKRYLDAKAPDSALVQTWRRYVMR